MSVPSIRPLTLGNALRASIVALMKNEEKPRATPCLALNESLYLARRSMTLDMSASLKVVRIAAVCWASTSRWAIFWRSPLIRFRLSRGRAPAAGAAGAGAGGAAGVGAAVAAAGGGGAGGGAWGGTAPLGERPPRPG